MTKLKTLIAVDMDDYIGRHRGRRQQLMSQLSLDYEIVYVDKMNSFIHSVRKHKWNVRNYLKYEIHVVSETLTFIKLPHIFLPFASSFRLINRINCKILNYFIADFYKKLAITKVDVLWVGHPYAGDLKLEGDLLVYDCFDEHSGFKGLLANTAVRSIERDLILKSDLAIFSAQYLSDKKSFLSNNSLIVRNGADYDHFYVDPESSLKHDGSILYSGVISDWVDIELLEYLVVNMPSFIFRFVGPVRKNWLESIKNYENVDIVGEVDYRELPKFYSAAAACIIPFDPGWELIKSTNPIKLYEYFAAGKPTVSTRFDEVEKCSDIVSLADNHEGFRLGLMNSIKYNSYDKALKRQAFARHNSWESRKDCIVSAIREIDDKATL